MPMYVYECRKHGCARHVQHSMSECDSHLESCPKCKRPMQRVIQATKCRVMAQGWEYLNDGRGQYISQLETVPNGKQTDYAFCRSHNELREKAAKNGFTVNRD